MATKPENEQKKLNRIGDLLPREEWDFSTCPEDRLGFCFAYEYARAFPEIIKRFRHAKKHDRSQFDHHGQWHHVISSDMYSEDGVYLEVIDAPVGFPKKPYLQTTHHITKESLVPFNTGQILLRSVVITPEGHYRAEGVRAPVDPEEVSHLQIDLRQADKHLIKAFAQWLKKAHGKRQKLETRGRGARRTRTDLKALGAVRLMRHFAKHGLTMEAARQYAGSQSIPKKWRLYEEQTDWSEAKKTVQAIKEQWLMGNPWYMEDEWLRD